MPPPGEAMNAKPDAGEGVESPITWEAPSFALFDVEANAVVTTVYGNLAIFSTRVMAQQWARRSARQIKVVPVLIRPVTEQ